MALTTRRGTKLAHNKKVEMKNSDEGCMLCGRKETSETLYGKLYKLNDVIIHHFCLVLSPRAVKNGTDEEGIHGFLSNDIKDELTRGSRETCVYCKKKGATISCCGVNCQKVFHLPCGLSNGSMHQYFGTFKSFCQQHRILPVIPALATTIECRICNDNIIQSTLENAIWAPCCKPKDCFHRECVQNLALRKGYFIECPICKNVEIFKFSILTLGIYIPSRYSTIKCNSEKCVCPHKYGEEYQNEYAWKIIICHTCKFRGSHRICGSIKTFTEWNCPICEVRLADIPPRRLELPIQGNCFGISAMGDVDSNGDIVKETQNYTPGYIQKH